MKLQRIDQKFQKFGKLFVLGTFGKDKAGRRLMLCWCECGRLAVVRADNLKQTATTGNKNSVSCGCVRVAASSKRSKALWADKNRAEQITKKMSVSAQKRWASNGPMRSINITRKWEVIGPSDSQPFPPIVLA